MVYGMCVWFSFCYEAKYVVSSSVAVAVVCLFLLQITNVYWSWDLSESSLVQSTTVLWVRKSGVVVIDVCDFHLKWSRICG